MINLQDKKIIVTGGAGFLGHHVVQKLRSINANPTIIRSKDYDLTKEQDIIRMYGEHQPQIVIHLAAVVGGIGINKLKPGSFFYKNLVMGAMLIEHARLNNVEKFTAIGTICAYPKHTPVPFKESDLWIGYPEETNAPYGLAKKMMAVQSEAYRQEYGFNSIYLLPVNLYGPRDNFDEASSHVIPALIKKCITARNANAPSIICWGTGLATREFLYVTDAADAIVAATEKYDQSDPINIGANREITIKDLVEKIADLCRFKGDIIWDATLPDGQPRRCLDTRKAKESFGFEAKVPFDEGLINTIAWYEETIK
jgi:GDP-L-fucose synthase